MGDNFQTLLETEFDWLLAAGFHLSTESYGHLGDIALLNDGRRWLRVRWEARESGVFVSWGEVLPPGRFNEDPFRLPKSPQELVPRLTLGELERAGAIGDDEVNQSLRAALHRLSGLIREAAVLIPVTRE